MMKINFDKAMKLAGAGTAKLVDTRSPVEYNKGTLGGAVNLVLRNISKIVVIGKKDDAIIFFGPDAAIAANYAFGMGYTKVYYMENVPNLGEEKVNN
jgi:rhodanese-related sulfurtransferase